MHPCATLLVLALLFVTGCVEIERELTATPDTSPGAIELSLRWDDLPVPYCLDLSADGYADGETFRRLVERAFMEWGVPARNDGRCDGALREDDGRNQVGWGAPPADASDGPGVYEAGFTRLRYRACSGGCPSGSSAEMLEADMIIDSEPPRIYRNQRCLYSVILHEVGHFLGIEHLPPPAVMSAVGTGCAQELTAADLRAAAERYGAKGGGP